MLVEVNQRIHIQLLNSEQSTVSVSPARDWLNKELSCGAVRATVFNVFEILGTAAALLLLLVHSSHFQLLRST